MPALPDFSFDVIDVRDVAAAHIAAMENSSANGHRYILSNRMVHLKEFSRIGLRDEFEPQGYKIASRDLPKVVVWIGKFLSSIMKELYHSLGKNLKFSNERMVSELGIQPRPVEESIIDICYRQSHRPWTSKEHSWISWTSIKTIADGLSFTILNFLFPVYCCHD
jgi:nucleoside-diphosphate-sugar epimerase